MKLASGPATAQRRDPSHRAWLRSKADALFEFFEPRSIDRSGGFAVLDEAGQPMVAAGERELHATTRMIHCFAIGHLLGRKGAAAIVDHGLRTLRVNHRDGKHGGYFWSFDRNGPRTRDKLTYGHGFVLLAGAAAKMIGHPDANALIADISEVLEKRFWDAEQQASREEFREDWSSFSDYRGQNANMHLTEALMAAFEATGETEFLRKAGRIAERIVNVNARAADWRVPEHYRADWTVDRDYSGSVVFRPAGLTPGHALEWSRLIMQLHALTNGAADWAPEAAGLLFRRAVAQGWDTRMGGFYYTTEFDGSVRVRDRLWWPVCEGAAAAAVIAEHARDEFFDGWYGRIWEFADQRMIEASGAWTPQLDDDCKPIQGYFTGRGDIYHALQACLIPLYSAKKGIVAAVHEAVAPSAGPA